MTFWYFACYFCVMNKMYENFQSKIKTRKGTMWLRSLFLLFYFMVVGCWISWEKSQNPKWPQMRIDLFSFCSTFSFRFIWLIIKIYALQSALHFSCFNFGLHLDRRRRPNCDSHLWMCLVSFFGAGKKPISKCEHHLNEKYANRRRQTRHTYF